MPAQPLVSVILPTFNRADVVCKTIDDVFRQTYKNIELIVIDDGSTDNTQEVLQRYGNRIQLFAQANAGPSAARNWGIELSRGDIIAFQDSDDFWATTKIERQVRLLERAGDSVPCCLCNMLMKNLHGDGKDRYSFDISLLSPPYEDGLWLNVTEVLASRFVMFNQAAAIRREPLEKIGGFDTSLKYLEDYDLSMRLSVEGPWAFITDPLSIWAGGATNSLSREAEEDGIVLSECTLKTLMRAQEEAQRRGDKKVEQQLRGGILSCRRSWNALHIAKSGSWNKRIMEELRSSFYRYRNGAIRRSPWFPRMKTIRIEGFEPDMRRTNPPLSALRS